MKNTLFESLDRFDLEPDPPPPIPPPPPSPFIIDEVAGLDSEWERARSYFTAVEQLSSRGMPRYTWSNTTRGWVGPTTVVQNPTNEIDNLF